MPLNSLSAHVGDAALITAFGHSRAGYVIAVSPTGRRVRVRYRSHATRERTGERWESVDRVLLVPASRICAHCDREPTRIVQHRQLRDVQQLVCERHATPWSPRLPRRPAVIA